MVERPGCRGVTYTAPSRSSTVATCGSDDAARKSAPVTAMRSGGSPACSASEVVASFSRTPAAGSAAGPSRTSSTVCCAASHAAPCSAGTGAIRADVTRSPSSHSDTSPAWLAKRSTTGWPASGARRRTCFSRTVVAPVPSSSAICSAAPPSTSAMLAPCQRPLASWRALSVKGAAPSFTTSLTSTTPSPASGTRGPACASTCCATSAAGSGANE